MQFKTPFNNQRMRVRKLVIDMKESQNLISFPITVYVYVQKQKLIRAIIMKNHRVCLDRFDGCLQWPSDAEHEGCRSYWSCQ
jgi:hypothetical protein